MGSWKSVLLGGGALLVAAGAAVLVGSASMASSQSVPSITLSPASQTMNMSDGEFTIEAKISGAQNLGSYELTLKFDPAVIEYVGSGDVGFLTSTGRTQSCFGHELGADTVNQYKVVHIGCATNGIVTGGQGKQGPSGSGTLSQIIFKPKAVGTANLQFDGYDDGNVVDNFYIGGPDPESPVGAVELGSTTLGLVEECPGANQQCSEVSIPFTYGSGVVTVSQTANEEPTALPPTPTPEPPDGPSGENYQKTVAAAVGTPRTLPTTAGGGSSANPTAPTGSTSGSETGGTTGGTTSSSGSTAGVILPPNTGERPLTASELQSTGAPAGSTIGSDGVIRTAEGVPLTGYGLQDDGPSAAWYWAGFAILLAGLAAMALGARASRLAADET